MDDFKFKFNKYYVRLLRVLLVVGEYHSICRASTAIQRNPLSSLRWRRRRECCQVAGRRVDMYD